MWWISCLCLMYSTRLKNHWNNTPWCPLWCLLYPRSVPHSFMSAQCWPQWLYCQNIWWRLCLNFFPLCLNQNRSSDIALSWEISQPHFLSVISYVSPIKSTMWAWVSIMVLMCHTQASHSMADFWPRNTRDSLLLHTGHQIFLALAQVWMMHVIGQSNDGVLLVFWKD